MLTTQVPVPEQPDPLQPVKVEPTSGAAVNVTLVPVLKAELQVAPQLIPAGLLVTVPVPAPLLVRFRLNVETVLKVAVTARARVMLTTQVPVPEQPDPLQPANTVPTGAAAVSVTLVVLAKRASQVDPQLIPAGLLVTVPDAAPVPDFVNLSCHWCARHAGEKAAISATCCFMRVATLPGRVPWLWPTPKLRLILLMPPVNR